MQVKEHVSEKLNEKYYEIEHSSGLRILFIPKRVTAQPMPLSAHLSAV